MGYCNCGEDKGRCIDCAEEILATLQENAALLDRSLMKSEKRRLELEEKLKRILDEPVGRRYYDMGGYDECGNCEDMQEIAKEALKEIPNEA